MYFKSLELFGFKSFAGRTRIEFEPGITAVVGPNGCGKSNVVDALKWVLGEQSAKDLRGVNMEDVIFNGTDTKDPVGFAEVSLVMSNESKFLPIEYDEVIITRRLFRSGDSEYLLNKNQVRLKDIIELFMGTGVGTSAYSIIEQGRIDMIISSKPEDRRYIFEEASGIIKYKSKKREAARKLEYTENNLLRINDIVEEVKRQIGSIERQARKAERYKEEFERLKQLDTKAGYYEFKVLNKAKEDIDRDVSGLKTEETAISDEISALSAKLADLKAQETAINAKLSEIQFKDLDMTSAIERSSDKIAMNEERHKELEEYKQSLLNEQAQAGKAIAELVQKIAALDNELGGVSENRARRQALLNKSETRFKELDSGLKGSEQSIRQGRLKIVDILSRTSKIRNDIAKFSSDLSNLQARERRLKTEEESVKGELVTVKGQFERIKGETDSLGKRVEDSKKENSAAEEELNRKEAALSDIEKKIETLNSRRLSIESRLALLKDMVKRYEGFGSGARSILLEKTENRLGIGGVHGALAELIDVRKRYETAVESCLGSLLECIVVENKKAAIDLINYLKAKNMGKATIVALDSIYRQRKEANPSAAGITGRLSEFVSAEGRFKDLISLLFDDIYVVKDEEALFAAASAGQEGIKFVTLSGYVLENGFLTGGAEVGDTNAGILNRKHHIKELEDELARIIGDNQGLQSQRETLLKEGNGLIEKINSITAIIRQDELALANKKSHREAIEASFKKINDESSLLALELDETGEEITSLRSKLGTSEIELKRLEEENAAIHGSIASAQAFIDAAVKEREVVLVEITKVRTELSGISEQENNFSAHLNLQNELLSNQRALLDEKEKSFTDAAERQTELKREIDSLRISIDEASKEKTQTAVLFQDIKDRKQALEGLTGAAGAELNQKQGSLNGLKEKIHYFQMALQENSFRLETLKTRISQAYKIELTQFAAEIEEGFDPVSAGNEISELKQRLEKMGPVNLVAIEEHQELKERFDFLTKQKEDLLNAKESLLEAIRKINKTTKDLFMDTFEKVRAEFKDYYRYLFGGGQAELVLMDEQDVLECGIEIMARPPGKKLQSISLLSGGEKAMTAIALLFSIFKVKPSPFCILDEIDAPLDESNIGRFTKLLSDFTKKSQFIVITHNKKTISMADVMYGITMQQSGVSKVVSVKFAKAKDKAPVAVASGAPLEKEAHGV
ncbi:MAG: chromosome segregation protein SMC [Candidatus Omnitrophica bacterium]|nr:chromosome segregation protein SMC [Candidatus Omnitrophota bacterium]